MSAPEPLSNERQEAIRARLAAVSPGPWERGDVWLWAGLIYSNSGQRVESGEATRCAFCHLGEPAWEGRADINGHMMPAHRHRSPDPGGFENAISSADGLVVYEGGGVVRKEDAEFITFAPEDVRCLLGEVERLRGVGASGGPVREVRIRVAAPTDENAGQWAQTIADLVTAEHGQEMRLDIRIVDPAVPVVSCVSPDVLDQVIAGMDGGNDR